MIHKLSISNEKTIQIEIVIIIEENRLIIIDNLRETFDANPNQDY